MDLEYNKIQFLLHSWHVWSNKFPFQDIYLKVFFISQGYCSIRKLLINVAIKAKEPLVVQGNIFDFQDEIR